ncbi:PSP1 domain-containing protein [Hymenobacter latericus]|uniref:PSP1 domain-containing protein n=1 Tax=Hymenobacter sp. YIM 151858-1 TaxID=2987688 RepID=UPI00222722A5|nr:regulatory iron-sulfur-containing complex subunit RicT [Hymenobacter sp. YIM 151858-1]UYZ59053.1 regulatory iron-sulfur-containing complex subunit RicT [Hymenobacter sp. YIM 151858-1]
MFDWLQDLDLPVDFKEFDIVEIRFKGGRKEFFRNASRLPLVTGDAVVVEAGGNGWHLGYVSLKGELVRLQMRKKKVEPDNKDLRNILRVATEQDVERYEAACNLELGTMFKARSVVDELQLKMKLSDVEYQADRTRATFYYSAEDRVDFRDLIKRLAEEFRVRVEMRQISLRHEAGRLGGIGSCGRELCCSTWLTEFKSVSTTAARYQNLSLNPAKLSGQCGRLKCCLNYELDTYLDALRDIPQVSKPLQTQQGDAFLQKTDIFKKRMWFAFRGDNNWVMLSTDRVKEIQLLNKAGEKPDTLQPPIVEPAPVLSVQEHVEGSLDRLDDKMKSGKRNKRKKKKEKTGPAPASVVQPKPTATVPKDALRPRNEPKPGPGSGEPGGTISAPVEGEGGPGRHNRSGRRGRNMSTDAPRADRPTPRFDPRFRQAPAPGDGPAAGSASSPDSAGGGEGRSGRNGRSRRGGRRHGGGGSGDSAASNNPPAAS